MIKRSMWYHVCSLIILYVIFCIKHCPAKMTNKCVFCKRKNALIHELGYFVTFLKELRFPLVYCPAVNKSNMERKQETMKHFLKGAVVVAGVTIVIMIINIIVNIVCNRNGIDLNATAMSMMSTFIGVLSGMLIYDKWIKDEK